MAKIKLAPDLKVWKQKEEIKEQKRRRASRELKSFRNIEYLLSSSPQRGDKIQKTHAKGYVYYSKKFNSINWQTAFLWRHEASGNWRAIYVILTEPVIDEIIVFIIDYVDHKTYNDIFGYDD